MRRATRRGACLAAIALSVFLTAVAIPDTAYGDGTSGARRLKVGVLVITMFDGETEPWLLREDLPERITVPGAFSPLHCNRDGLCVAKIGMGKSHAAVSMMALLDSPELDFSDAYFLTAGIAGTPPDNGTLGFAAWARWVVDFDLGHHVLPQAAPDIPHGYLPFDTEGTNVFRLNDELVDRAYKLTKDLSLSDSREAAENRSHYEGQADQHPYVDVCDTATGDNYWAGKELSESARYIVDLWTQGEGEYCTTQMEDNAVAAALAAHGYLDRYLSLRTASDFDQPYPGQDIRELFTVFPGYEIAVDNAYLVGSAVAKDLLGHSFE